MTRRALSVDAAIVGGGIGGLWIANLLAQRGLSVVLCEPRGVGGVQTMASQGIVHGGTKYGTGPTPLSGALEAMPSRWRACLRGAGEIDLKGVGLLAEQVHFHVGEESRQLDDFVLDVASLVRRLAEPISNRVLAATVSPESVVPGRDGVDRIDLATHTIRARVYVLAAGAGSQALAEQVGFAHAAIRHRPLRQTIVRLRRSAGVYAHWTPSPSQVEPVLTVTSHGHLLSIGGTVADDGVFRSESDHLATVGNLLRRAFPTIDLGDAACETFVAVRAEPEEKAIRDIPDAYTARHGNCLLCLPVKLSLAPRLGDLVVSEVGDPESGRKVWLGDRESDPTFAPSPYRDHPC